MLEPAIDSTRTSNFQLPGNRLSSHGTASVRKREKRRKILLNRGEMCAKARHAVGIGDTDREITFENGHKTLLKLLKIIRLETNLAG